MVTIIHGMRQKSPFAAGIESAANAFFGPDRMNAKLRQSQLEKNELDMAIADREARAATEYAQSLSPNFGNAALGGFSAKDTSGFNLLDEATRAGREGGDLLGNRGVNAAQLGAGMSAGNTGLGFREGETNQTNRTLGSARIGAGATIQSARIAAAQRAAAAQATLGENARQFGLTPQVGIRGGQQVFVPQNDLFSPDVRAPESFTQTQGRLLGDNFENVDSLSPRQATGIGALPSETQVQGEALARTLPHFDPTMLPPGAVNEAFGFKPQKLTYLYNPQTKRQARSVDNGLTDADTGEDLRGYVPLPTGTVEMTPADAGLGPTSTNATEANRRAASLRSLTDNVSALRTVAENNPQAIGLQGQVLQFGQGLSNAAEAAVNLMGGSEAFEQQLLNARTSILDPNRVDPSGRAALSALNDPSLDAIDQMYNLILYQVAEALAGQSGQQLSDKDVAKAKKIVPDPKGIGQSQGRFLANLGNIENLIAGQVRANEEQRSGAFNPVSPGAAPQPGAVEDGYRFIGGDPANPASWVPAQ